MFHAKTFLFDHNQNDMFLLQLTVEYNVAASLNIRINNKLSTAFFHSWKTFSLLTCATPCHTYAGVDFEVISVPVNT